MITLFSNKKVNPELEFRPISHSSKKTKEEDKPQIKELEAETQAKEVQGLHLVEDEVLVQGFILSEAHSLMVRPVLLFVF